MATKPDGLDGCPAAPLHASDAAQRRSVLVSTVEPTPSARGTAAGLVLLTLASGQFLMTLDSSVPAGAAGRHGRTARSARR